MDIQVNESGNHVLIKVSGVIQVTNVLELSRCIEKYSTVDYICHVILDFEDVSFIDSSGVGGLVYSNKILKKHNKTLTLDPLPSHIRSLFIDCSMDYWFEIPGLKKAM